MWGLLKKILLGVGVLALLLVAGIAYAIYADQRNLRAATNPCERACVQDSGGIDQCRRDCASHPLTYGPAVP